MADDWRSYERTPDWREQGYNRRSDWVAAKFHGGRGEYYTWVAHEMGFRTRQEFYDFRKQVFEQEPADVRAAFNKWEHAIVDQSGLFGKSGSGKYGFKHFPNNVALFMGYDLAHMLTGDYSDIPFGYPG